MITGLADLVWDRQLQVHVDLQKAVIGVDASISDNLDSIVARTSEHGASLFVVFDGPAVQLLPHYELRDSKPAGARWLMRELTIRKIPWIVAPGQPGAQLASLYRAGVITHVLANHGDEALLFGDIPMIMDLPSGTSTKPAVVPSRQTIMDSLSVPAHIFVELCLGAGCRVFVIPPSLIEAGSGVLGAAKGSQLAGGSLFGAIAAREQGKIESFQRGLATVAWQPFLTETGETRLTNKHNQPVPHNVHEVIGYHLPDEFMWYVSKGYVGSELCHAITFTRLDDPYRPRKSELVKEGGPYHQLQSRVLHPLRKQSLGLLVSRLQRYFQMKTVVDLAASSTDIVKPGINGPRLASPTEGSAPLDDANAIVANVLSSVFQFAALSAETKTADAPFELIKRAGLPQPSNPLSETDRYLVASATLALRQLFEAVLVTRFSLGHFNVKVDHNELITSIPWY